MKCVIIANGDLDYSDDTYRIIKDAQLIICADGGAGHLKALNILPHVIIGDFDSIDSTDKKNFEEKKIKTVTFPTKKNHSDTELCVSYAIKKKATDITLLGVTGTRLDHTMANIFLLTKLAKLKISARIMNKNNEIYIVTDSLQLKGKPKDLLSIIPVTREAIGVTLKGLEYPLVNATLKMGSSLGISNVFKKDSASVFVEKGILIVTKSKD
jgi:thiamine pyrophosphokinase